MTLQVGGVASLRASSATAPWSLPPDGSPTRPPSHLSSPAASGPPFLGSPIGSPAASAGGPWQAPHHLQHQPLPPSSPTSHPPLPSPYAATHQTYQVPAVWPAPYPQPAHPIYPQPHHPPHRLHHAYPQPPQQLHYTAQHPAFHPHPGRSHQRLHGHHHLRTAAGGGGGGAAAGRAAGAAAAAATASGGRQLLLSPRQQHQLYVELLQLQQLQEQQQASVVSHAAAGSPPILQRGTPPVQLVSATTPRSGPSHRPLHSQGTRVSPASGQHRYPHSSRMQGLAHAHPSSRQQGSGAAPAHGSASAHEAAPAASAVASTGASPLRASAKKIAAVTPASWEHNGSGRGTPEAAAAQPRTPQHSTPGSGGKRRDRAQRRQAPGSIRVRLTQHELTPTRLSKPRPGTTAASSGNATSATESGSSGATVPAAPKSAAAPYGTVVPWLRLMTNTAAHARIERSDALEVEAEVVAALMASAAAAAAAAAESRARHVREQVAAALATAGHTATGRGPGQHPAGTTRSEGRPQPHQPVALARKGAAIAEAALIHAVGSEHLTAPLPHVAVLRETRRQHHARHALLVSAQLQSQPQVKAPEVAGVSSAGGVQLPSRPEQQPEREHERLAPGKEHSLLAEWVQHGEENQTRSLIEERAAEEHQLQLRRQQERQQPQRPPQQLQQQGSVALFADFMAAPGSRSSRGSQSSGTPSSASASTAGVRGAAPPALGPTGARVAPTQAASQVVEGEGVQGSGYAIAAPARSSSASVHTIRTTGGIQARSERVQEMLAEKERQQDRPQQARVAVSEGARGSAKESLALLSSVAQKLESLASAQ